MSMPPPPSDRPSDPSDAPTWSSEGSDRGPGRPAPPPPPSMTPPSMTPPYAPAGPPAPWGANAVYAPMGAPVPGSRFSGMAITGFVLSLVGLLPCFWIWIQIPGVLGVIFSLIGLRATKDHRSKGRGLAIAGLAVGLAAIAATVAFTAFVYTTDNCRTDGLEIDCNFN